MDFKSSILQAEQLKADGTALFKQGDYRGAVAKYSKVSGWPELHFSTSDVLDTSCRLTISLTTALLKFQMFAYLNGFDLPRVSPTFLLYVFRNCVSTTPDTRCRFA